MNNISNIDYCRIELKSEDDYERVTEICERELKYWCNPESSPEPNVYRNMGYVEAVRNALEDARIDARIDAIYYARRED